MPRIQLPRVVASNSTWTRSTTNTCDIDLKDYDFVDTDPSQGLTQHEHVLETEELLNYLGKRSVVIGCDVSMTSSPACLPAALPSSLLPSSTLSLPSDLGISCDVCNKTFSRNCDLNKHMNHHTRPFTCECGSSFGSKANLNSHKRTHQEKAYGFQCQQCSFVCQRTTELNRHLRKHLRKTFTCERCGKIYHRQDVFKKHACLQL